MKKWIKNTWNRLVSKLSQPITLSERKAFIILDIDIDVPYHIKEIAKLYPICHTVAGNRAVGEIKKFEFVNKPNALRVGQAIILTDTRHKLDSTWIHLGFDFFKLVLKA